MGTYRKLSFSNKYLFASYLIALLISSFAVITDDSRHLTYGQNNTGANLQTNLNSNSFSFSKGDTLSANLLQLSNTSGISDFPQITITGNNVYVVWEQSGGGLAGNSEIYFTKSDDNGFTFDEPINLSNTTGLSLNPKIASSIDGGAYVVWEESGGGLTGNSEIYFTKSQNNGTIGNTTNLSNSTGDSLDPQLSVTRNQVNVIWKDDVTGDFDIYFVKSEDNGATFDRVINISTTFGNSVSAKIASSGSEIYVVWKDYTINSPTRSEILFIRSTDGGDSFNDVKDLSQTDGESLNPQIAVYKNNIYITWVDTYSGTGNILFTRSQNYGEDFDTSINLSNNNGESSFPQIASLGILSGSEVFITWSTRDADTGKSEVYFTSSNNNGATFPPSLNLSNSEGDARHAHIAVGQRGAVMVVWSEMNDSLNSEILFDRVV